MKKILIYLLLLSLAFSLMTGCKKKEDTEEINLDQSVEENQNEEVATDIEAEQQEETVDEIEYILYLKYKDKPFLYDEVFSVNINDEELKDKSIEEFVLDQLLNYDEEGPAVSPVPEGTKILSIEREDKNVIVNLSKEFTEKKMSSSDAALAAGGIINSIVALPGNETAQIMVEGKVLESYNGVKLSEPSYFMEGLFPDK